jgi:hypothetical protein
MPYADGLIAEAATPTNENGILLGPLAEHQRRGPDRSRFFCRIPSTEVTRTVGRGSVSPPSCVKSTLSPGLPARTVAANPPPDRHERENEEGQHEETEHDPKSDIRRWSKAD